MLISPEMAILGRSLAPVRRRTSDVAMVAPAEGPFFSASQDGKLRWMSRSGCGKQEGRKGQGQQGEGSRGRVERTHKRV
jgi:hypothetical protein